MGTRSLTYVYKDTFSKKDNPEIIICLYRQYDGYPQGGHGEELAEFLLPIKITNGISGDSTNTANGMGCLAAQMVAHFKKEVGGFYLYPTLTGDAGQDYEYHIYSNKVVVLETYNSGKKLFSGTWKEFAKFCKEPQKDEEE